jgi:hypothetical protein
VLTVSAARCSAASCSGVPSGLTANVWAATVVVVAVVVVVVVGVVADDGCAMVVLVARVWVVLLVDVFASFLDLRPGVGGSSASSFGLDVLPSVDFASSFVDDVGEALVPAAPSSPLEAPEVEADVVDDFAAADVVDDFDSEDFESADEALEEPD